MPETPDFDVARGLSAMADFPAVLRRLGIIRRLQINLADNPGLTIDPNGGPVTITVRPSFTGASANVPVTFAPVSVPAFLSPSRFALTDNGRVDLSEANVGLVEIDTDSAALMLVDLARQMYNADTENLKAAEDADKSGEPYLEPVQLPERMALPSLRNAGMSVNESDRAPNLRDKLEKGSSLLNAAGPVVLENASQAVMGHVLDVWDDKTNRWRSLCARVGTYKLPGSAAFIATDEGTISLAAASNPELKEGKAPLYLHQSMIRWTGWSLVAPRPGELVETEQVPSPEDPTAADRRPKPPTAPALPGFDAKFVAQPGTLPRLRFGVGYRFGLRMVDVAGRADPLVPTSTDFTRATPPTGQPPARYLRFEPVVAPIVVPTGPMTEGESLETLVIRAGTTAAAGVNNAFSPITSAAPVRHLAPPKVNVQLCEDHSMFDSATKAPDPAKYSMIAARDRADLSKVGNEDPRRAGQRYVSTLTMSWLPDPISRGAALNGLPGGPQKIRFDQNNPFGTWPVNVGTIRLQLSDGNGSPSWNQISRVLNIPVPRGEMRTPRLSSFIDPADLALLGHLEWLKSSGASAATVTAVQNDMLAGTAWQITPYRSLTLVNAVRVPVTAPVLGLDLLERAVGTTKAELSGLATVHRPSTGSLNLLAKWTDPIDDPSPADNPAPPKNVAMSVNPMLTPPGGAPGSELRVDYDADPVTGAGVGFTVTHLFNDTKRHQVTYTATGTTRYMEFFVQRGNIKLTGVTPFKVSTAGIVPGTDSLRSVDGQTVYQRDVDYVVKPDAGTLERTADSSIPSGALIEAAIVAPPVTATSSPGVFKDIPSTARPLPPKVAWIVPTFGWTENSSGRTKQRNRGGGGLRIFLERPWYSSGVGEQLAVVLLDGAPPTNIDSDHELRKLVTELGRDPVVASANPSRFPVKEAFTLATIRNNGIKPAELVGTRDSVTLAVAAHDVVWDTDRQRWACDIVLPPGVNYQPFVKLALARYQHNSAGDTHLSPIADVEWVQLAPDRSATVVKDSRDAAKITLTVVGRSAGRTDSVAGPNALSYILQTTTAASPTDFDWRPVGPDSGVRLPATTQPDNTTMWTTTFTLPSSGFFDPNKYRLVLVEYEQFGGGSRLVYSDVIPL